MVKQYMENEELFLGIMPLNEAKRIQKKLAELEVPSELKTNDATCTTGCTVTVELWTDSQYEDQVRAFFSKEQERDLGGLEINAAFLNETFDPEADEVTCQACGEKFGPKVNASECPECGLVY